MKNLLPAILIFLALPAISKDLGNVIAQLPVRGEILELALPQRAPTRLFALSRVEEPNKNTVTWLYAFDIADPAHPRILSARSDISSFSVSSNGDVVAVVPRANNQQKSSSPTELLSYLNPENPVRISAIYGLSGRFGFNPDGSRLALIQRDSTNRECLNIYNLQDPAFPTLEKKLACGSDSNGPIFGAFSHDGKSALIYTGRYKNKSLIRYSLADGQPTVSFPINDSIYSPIPTPYEGNIGPSGFFYFGMTQAPFVAIYQFTNKSLAHVNDQHGELDSWAPIAISPDEKRIAIVRSGSIAVVNIENRSSPRVEEMLPYAYSCNAISFTQDGKALLAGSPQLLSVLSLTPPSLREVYTSLIERAHSTTIQNFPGFAAGALEAAGLLQAISNPPDRLTPQQLAQIAVKYVYWKTKSYSFDRNSPLQWANISEILRKAQKLDPSSLDVNLQLGKTLQTSLPFLLTENARRSATSEILASYKNYIRLGGSPSQDIQDFFALNLIERPISNVCDHIIQYANAGRLSEILMEGPHLPPEKEGSYFSHFSALIDIDNDGKPEAVHIRNEGTAHYDALLVGDPKSGDAEYIDTGIDVPELHPLLFEGKYFLLGTEFYNYPKLLMTIEKGNSHTVCKFASTPTRTASPSSKNMELCKRILGGWSPKYVKSEKLPPHLQSKIQDELEDQDTLAQRIVHVDFANSGVKSRLVEMEFNYAHGPGCIYSYFDLLRPQEGEIDIESPTRKQLLELQDVSIPPLENIPVPHCSNNITGWFSYNGSIYYETRFSGNSPESSDDEFHIIRRIYKGKTETACDIKFKPAFQIIK